MGFCCFFYPFFLYIIFYRSRRTNQLVNEAAGSRLSVTASVTFFCHVYVLVHNRQWFVQQTTGACFAKTCTLYPIVEWARALELSHHKPTAPECSYCVHTDPSEQHSGPKSLWVDLNSRSVKTTFMSQLNIKTRLKSGLLHHFFHCRFVGVFEIIVLLPGTVFFGQVLVVRQMVSH